MRTAIAGLLLALSGGTAAAEEMTVLPLVPPSELLVGAAGDQQSATVEKFGQVSIQEISLAKFIGASDSVIDAVKQHASHFDFYFVPLKFGVLEFDGKKCKWLQFGATLNAVGAQADQVFVLNVFPETSLKEGSLGADVKLTIASDVKVSTPESAPVEGGLSVGGSANVIWKWSPLYQQVAAVYDQTRVLWRFDAVGSEFPVGQVEVATIIAVAKSYSKGPKTKLGFNVEIRASFGGWWFEPAGLARSTTMVVVRLP